MASFLDGLSTPYMGQMGLGLLAAAQAQPPGVNRFSLLSHAIQQANQQKMAAEMFGMQKEEYEEKKKQRMSQATARSQLFGGPDPSTGIDWSSGRVGMTDAQAAQTAFRAYPEQAGDAMIQGMFPKPEQTTGAVKDAIAIGLKPGTPEFTAYIRERTLPRPPQTNVNIKWPVSLKETEAMLSRGEYYKRDKGGNIVFDERGLPEILYAEGGQTGREIEEEERKRENLQESRNYYGSVVLEDTTRGARILADSIRRGKNKYIPNTVAGWGGVLKFIPGTDAKQLSTLMATVRANIGFDRLQVMRQNSPSGGALGNVSNFEVDTLQATQGSLDQTQKPEELLENIIRINAMYAAITSRKDGLVNSAALDDPNPDVSGPEKKKFDDLVSEIREEMRKEFGLGVTRWRYDPQTGRMEPE